MLRSLSIENIAIIKKVHIDFNEGFNVLTGETGAGKSILIDAINAVMGERTYKELIRSGCENANVTAVFDNLDYLSDKLFDFGITLDDGKLFLQRTLNTSGKNICRINGNQVPLSTLKDVATLLIDIHGQHDNRNLLNPDNHIHYLDKYASNSDLINDYYKSYSNLKSARRELNSIYEKLEDTERLLDLYSFQCKEIESANISIGERQGLVDKRERAKNAKLISQKLSETLTMLIGDDGAVSSLEVAAKDISDIKKYLSFSEEIDAKFLAFSYELSAISGEIKNLLDNNDFSEAELESINDRISFIDDMCRKYGGSEEAIINHYEKISNELSLFSSSEISVKELEDKIEILENEVIDKANKITASRKAAAKDFCEKLCNTLQFLQMPNVMFDVNFQQGKYKANGCDDVEFLISANPGQPLKPISKIASGGELSRIMLAIKSVFSDIDDIGTIIFDEIDTGISGTAADKVGTKLVQIADNRQIICVTHLAQIAAKANTHFLIEKTIDFNTTETKVNSISGEDRVKEIARIISGGELTDNLKATAIDLLTK